MARLLVASSGCCGSPRRACAKDAAPAAADPALEARMQRIAAELRCLVCQNQTIADSQRRPRRRPAARDARAIARSGASDEQVVQYMTDRYGDFIRYRPPFKGTTAVLWLGPGRAAGRRPDGAGAGAATPRALAARSLRARRSRRSRRGRKPRRAGGTTMTTFVLIAALMALLTLGAADAPAVAPPRRCRPCRHAGRSVEATDPHDRWRGGLRRRRRVGRLCLDRRAAGARPRGAHGVNDAPRITAAQIEAMVEKLAARLKEQPNDVEGWTMLGRSYAVLGRHEQASAAFKKALELKPDDPALLTDYADTLAASNGGNLEGEPSRLLTRALRHDPNNQKALSLAGICGVQPQGLPAGVAALAKTGPDSRPTASSRA